MEQLFFFWKKWEIVLKLKELISRAMWFIKLSELTFIQQFFIGVKCIYCHLWRGRPRTGLGLQQGLEAFHWSSSSGSTPSMIVWPDGSTLGSIWERIESKITIFKGCKSPPVVQLQYRGCNADHHWSRPSWTCAFASAQGNMRGLVWLVHCQGLLSNF